MKFISLRETGTIPHRVELGTRSDRGDRLYLRWRIPGNWKWEGLKGLKASDPRDLRAGELAMQRQCARLLVGVPEAAPVQAPVLTILQGLTLAIDPKAGKYPEKNQHRDEVEREVRRAAVILGDLAFTDIDEGKLTELWRERMRQLLQEGRSAQRAAEITVQRLLAVAAWLRKRKHIPVTACLAPADWQDELESDWRRIAKQPSNYQPKRPRHTVGELQRILAVLDDPAHRDTIDPRFSLLLDLGAELRLGQVARTRRSALNLEEGYFQPPSTGKKKAPKVFLTPGQRAAVDRALGEGGYLRTLELRWLHDGQDYTLFPGRRLLKGQALYADAKPMARSPIRRFFREVEELAKVPHVEGRAAYGLRRAGVDGMKDEGASREELKEGGGWTDSTIPDTIYADQEADGARRRAATLRAIIRGET